MKEDYDSLGLSETDLMKVRASESKTHSELCAVQSFCLNGGTCYRLRSLAMHYCECPDKFEGRRCHTKKMVVDYESREASEAASLNWNTIIPVILVIGGVFLCVLALFCVYLSISFCYRLYWNRKGKYRFAQPSGSDLPLVVEENSKDDDGDGDSGTRASPKSRARLTACSSTPEPMKPLGGVDIGGAVAAVVVQRPAQDQRTAPPPPSPPPPPSNARATATDVELGRSGGGVVVVSSVGKPSHSPSTGSGRTAGRRPSLIAAAAGGGCARANSRSPSDSNNNDDGEETLTAALRNSSAASVSALRREAGGRQPGHFAHRQETRYHLVSDSPSSRKQRRDPYYDDTDRGSTAV